MFIMLETVGKSLLVFILAGLCEIGGGYLVWLWMKADKPLWYGILGGIILAAYGVVATFQPAGFGRVYATYGGIFIGMSLLWAWYVDGFRPDKYDILGALIALVGVCIIYYAPRT
ncbi:YnfA family protein [Spirosoma terrae]|uniref:YnfA family protein n=2 Tax=Spirosoma terrae TaxID=1968276 RepID=A0A6L9L856_9BACT|nr:YnfA family protein [Spirosoma terrae]